MPAVVMVAGGNNGSRLVKWVVAAFGCAGQRLTGGAQGVASHGLSSVSRHYCSQPPRV